MENLFIVDASGYIYRSYFAIRNMTNHRGESTNALFGFLRSILKLRKDFQPTHLVAVFDGPQSIQYRKAMYAEYKAQRAATPPDLGYQIERAKQACGLLGIPVVALPEVEADDAMGSIAVWGGKVAEKVYICTSDKDLYQLVNDRICILNTYKDNQILCAKESEEFFGVPPSKMIDYLAITGDTSDNVPGLPGFGPKTAAALLNQYGTLDYILDHPEVVTGKKQEIIAQHREQALLSRKLVTIHTELPIPHSVEAYAIKHPEIDDLKKFYADMSFNSLIRELEEARPTEAPVSSTVACPFTYCLVDTKETLDKVITELKQHHEICLATHLSAPNPFKGTLQGIALCYSAENTWYIPLKSQLDKAYILDSIQSLLNHPNIKFYGHNIKTDLQALANEGLSLKSICFDTMLASYLLSSHIRQHTLEQLVLEHFGKVLTTEAKKGKALAVTVPLEAIFGEAVSYIVQLKGIFEKQLDERKLTSLLQNLEIPLLSVLASMERHGIYLDIPYLKQMSVEVVQQITQIEQEIYALAGTTFNINSPKQVSEVLFTKLGIKAPKKTATGLSTGAEVLEFLQKDYPIAGKLLEYRVFEKLRSTYLEALPLEVNAYTHRIHCTFNQTVAATGRLSCQEPNLQNIPIRSEIGRQIRGAFRPQLEGWSYLAADYSQIELRLLAHFSEDPLLIQAFKNKQDIHALTAAVIYGLPLEKITKDHRPQAKAVNFGIVYGQQAFGLSQELGIEVKEAALFIENYFKQYTKVKEFIETCREKARQTGKAVTYTGRERLIPEIHSKNGILRSAAERLAINTPLQGTAADLIKLAMLQIDKQLKEKNKKSYMILQIHDELIFEVPDEELSEMQTLVKETMENVFQFKVPLEVDIAIGKNWAEC